MRKKIILIVVFLLAFSSTGMLFSQKNSEDGKFEKELNSYLDKFWGFYPTAATLAGYHKYDNKLDDLSEKNLDKRHEALGRFNQYFVAKIDKYELSLEVQIDHEIVIDSIDFEIFRLENLLPWEYNPIFYNNILNNCIRSLFSKEFAPIETRAKNAADRLKGLPKLIKQAKENLKTPPQLFTETAIKQFPGIIDFYKNELPQLIEETPADSKSKLQKYLNEALPVLEDYQNFLQNELLPKSTGNFRLGQQAHQRILRLTLQTDTTVQEFIDRANADYNNIRREMFLVCLGYFRIMYPDINMEQLTAKRGEEEMRNITIKGVMDKIKREHVAKEEYIDRIKTITGEIKNFVIKNDLLELPEESLNIELMPLESQGITWTRLVPPGIYETSGTYSFQVTPIPEDWDEDKTNSFLEEYNNFLLYFWTSREVYPGQFVPMLYTRQFSSQLRNLLPNMPIIKAWPIFLEEKLVTSGFGNYDLKLRLNQLKLLLKAVMDFQLELNIHTGGMTKEQAIAYMTGRGFQTIAEAERKWNHIILNPGNSACAYVGYQEILDMEKNYKELKGNSFNQKEFFKKLLSYGALPLRHLKKKILE